MGTKSENPQFLIYSPLKLNFLYLAPHSRSISVMLLCKPCRFISLYYIGVSIKMGTDPPTHPLYPLYFLSTSSPHPLHFLPLNCFKFYIIFKRFCPPPLTPFTLLHVTPHPSTPTPRSLHLPYHLPSPNLSTPNLSLIDILLSMFFEYSQYYFQVVLHFEQLSTPLYQDTVMIVPTHPLLRIKMKSYSYQ